MVVRKSDICARREKFGIWNLDLVDLGLPDSGMWNYWVTGLGTGMIGIEENDEKKFGKGVT